MQKALQLWGRHTVQIQTADAHSVLAIAYNFMGNFALAEHHLSCAISCCDQLHDEKGKINNLIRMATSKQRQGAYADAETILTQILSEPTASILLQQKRYDEARIFFSALETSLKATGLKRELLRVKVRLAMCYLTGAVRLMEEIASILETQDYGQLVLTAIHAIPRSSVCQNASGARASALPAAY